MEIIKVTYGQKNRIDKEVFDILLPKEPIESSIGANTIGELLFSEFTHRPEGASIIRGHIGNEMHDITLKELRGIVAKLFQLFSNRGIRPGETILLPNFEYNNELYLSIFFIALTSYGVEVFMPMYMERSDIDDWLQRMNVDKMILPFQELKIEGTNDKVQANIDHLISHGKTKMLIILDSFQDFNIDALVLGRKELYLDAEDRHRIHNCISKVKPSQLALWITTSGTTGISK